MWTVLRDDNGDVGLVVPEGTPVIEAVLTLVQETYGGDLFSPDNPAIVQAAEGLRVERWHSCTKAFREAECIGDGDPDGEWWAPHGDGKRTIFVLPFEGDAYSLGEEAEALESTEPGTSPEGDRDG